MDPSTPLPVYTAAHGLGVHLIASLFTSFPVSPLEASLQPLLSSPLFAGGWDPLADSALCSSSVGLPFSKGVQPSLLGAAVGEPALDGGVGAPPDAKLRMLASILPASPAQQPPLSHGAGTLLAKLQERGKKKSKAKDMSTEKRWRDEASVVFLAFLWHMDFSFDLPAFLQGAGGEWAVDVDALLQQPCVQQACDFASTVQKSLCDQQVLLKSELEMTRKECHSALPLPPVGPPRR